MRAAASSTEETRNPFPPSSIWCRMRPTFPPITGLPFHIASATVKPNPSRIDFCSTTAARRCNAFTNAVSFVRENADSFALKAQQGLIHLLTFRIIHGNIAKQYKGTVNFTARQLVSLMTPSRILPAIEARVLHDL